MKLQIVPRDANGITIGEPSIIDLDSGYTRWDTCHVPLGPYRKDSFKPTYDWNKSIRVQVELIKE